CSPACRTARRPGRGRPAGGRQSPSRKRWAPGAPPPPGSPPGDPLRPRSPGRFPAGPPGRGCPSPILRPGGLISPPANRAGSRVTAGPRRGGGGGGGGDPGASSASGPRRRRLCPAPSTARGAEDRSAAEGGPRLRPPSRSPGGSGCVGRCSHPSGPWRPLKDSHLLFSLLLFLLHLFLVLLGSLFPPGKVRCIISFAKKDEII
uniref:Uncharacterized protein n=1 Tax=Canis lupus familiaris TaxID=9615 RepID=A0A8I3N7I6_CANLF